MTDLLLRVLRLHHSDNPVLSPHLESVLNLPGPQVRDAINQLRSGGIPICSSQAGYWMGRYAEEVSSTIRHLETRAAAIGQAAAGLRQAQGALPPQPGEQMTLPLQAEEAAA